MNIWIEKSIALATKDSYLDQLCRIYPVYTSEQRELTEATENAIREYLVKKDGVNLLKILLKQQIFPIKDPYVSFLKRDKTAFERNPATFSRLVDALLAMSFEEILEKTTIPRDTKRNIGELLRKWVNRGALGVPVCQDPQQFMDYPGNAVFDGSDGAMRELTQHLGYGHHEWLDFIGKFNGTFVLGEANYLGDFGGNQYMKFKDSLATLRSPLRETAHRVRIIAILDGVLYLNKLRNRMCADLQALPDHEIVISVILLRDFLYSL